MKHYITLQTTKTRDGLVILKEGDKLIPFHKNFNCYGKDHRNLFYTDDFLDSKPQLFKRVNG